MSDTLTYCNCINWHPPTPGTRICSYCGKHMLNEKERQEQIKKQKPVRIGIRVNPEDDPKFMEGLI